MRGPHNLIIYPNATYARAFGPLSCTCTRVCTHARMRVCTCARVCTYVRVCVRARMCVCAHHIRVACNVYVHACVYGCLHTCVHARTCVRVCMRVRVHACACEGIEGALPLGVLPPQERASLPSCLSTLGALRGGLGGSPNLCPLCY